MKARLGDWWITFLLEYGMVLVLLALCALLGVMTYSEQHPNGAEAGRRLGSAIVGERGPKVRVLIAVGKSELDRAFAEAARETLTEAGVSNIVSVQGTPREAAVALRSMQEPDVIACNESSAQWLVFANHEAKIVRPAITWWPTFLTADNLRNIAYQISIIAIVAIGMTMVIIAGGIDLSVGSLIGLSAMLTTYTIVQWAGAEEAEASGMIACSLLGIATCGLIGLVSGMFITYCKLPAFIVTLAVLMIAGGHASDLSQGESIYNVPASFTWLGRGTAFVVPWTNFAVPNMVLLMLILYVVAHLAMSRTVLGRYLYAVGGNREAARLSGVPVVPVLLFAYAASGLLAGLGGVMMASQLKSASPSYGTSYELYVIAAVVVGGTSLSGGKGNMIGTLIGALVIAVIQNGMDHMTNVDSFKKRIVFGWVILLAVLFDRLKTRYLRGQSDS